LKKKCIVFTSLIDIGREEIDGRSFLSYTEWLQDTINLFPNIILFHDKNLDLNQFQGSFIPINISNIHLQFMPMETRVKRVLSQYKPTASSDITFELAKYALVQYSKFEFASHVIKKFETDSVLWVDAGISRFMDDRHINQETIDLNSAFLVENEIGYAFEIDLRKNLDPFKKFSVKNAQIGTCRRIISGTSFWINAIQVPAIERQMLHYVNELLKNNEWDNEQVALRNIISNLDPRILFWVQGKEKTGSVLRRIQARKIRKHHIIKSRIILKMLK
jgi:hypothetical protein